MVGLVGFEPTTSASRTQRSTKLSHSPNYLNDKYLQKFEPTQKRCFAP